MAQYKYEGRDLRGTIVKGTMTATTQREVAQKLREKNIRVSHIVEQEKTVWNTEITLGNPVKLQDFVVYCRQFATLLRAGVSVVDSTRILAEQTESKALARALVAIEEEIRSGNPLSAASAKFPKIFPPIYVSLTRAGEATGNMDETLERLANHFERQHFTKQKIKAAMAYPLVVGFIAVIVVIFLLVKVVPTFVDMFDDFNAELPALTQFVMGASEFMQHYWWMIVLGVLAMFILYQIAKRDPKISYFLDYALFRIPIFGKLFQKSAVATLTRTLSSLFASSVPALQAMSIVENVVDNKVMTGVIRQSRDALEAGISLSEPMKKSWVFPPMVTQMIAIGEETGTLDIMLSKVADFYEREVEIATDRIKALIEPLMIVVLAGLVGTIVLSIMIPMFEIFNHIQ